jgi:hypothetical protein
MVRFLSIALLSVSVDLLLGSAAAQPVTDFVIEPGRRAGIVTPDMTEPRLVIIERNAARPDQPGAWSLVNGMRLGMSIHRLQAAAGEPFEVLLCSCEFSGVVVTQPKSFAFRKLELSMDVPEGARKALKPVTRPDNDDAIHAADVPAEMAQDFVVSKIAVSLEQDYEED